MRTYLTLQGCNVVEFADGESFKESVGDIKAHVAILDLNLPGISGMELLPLLRKTLDIPTIVYTGVRKPGYGPGGNEPWGIRIPLQASKM